MLHNHLRKRSGGERNGFTLLEMLLAVALLTVLFGIMWPVYQSMQERNDLQVATVTIGQAMRQAQRQAFTNAFDSPWGVKLIPGAITIFKGVNYAARDVSFDEDWTINPTFILSGPSEIVFAQITGVPTPVGSIDLTSLNNATSTVSIAGNGLVRY